MEEAKKANEDGVDLLEEAGELSLSRSALYQQDLRRYHASRIWPRAFREGDLVLRLIQDTKGRNKLPFVANQALLNNAY